MLTAQTQTTLTLLMLAGAVFAGAGLWLLLRPKPVSGTAKLEFFGMKFESSSAGILVFLIGAIFLSVPLFTVVESKPPQADGPGSATGPNAARATGQMDNATPEGQALLLPAGPDAVEREPNDDLRSSNQISLGSIVSGAAHNDASDWLVVPTRLDAHRKLEAKLLTFSSNWVEAEVYDAREKRLAKLQARREAEYHVLTVGENERFYFRIYGVDDTPYEFSVRLLDE